ncbi:MAG TPA: carboxypeptidase-like regulatory domain-containing protein [Gemmatimonadales bacterium]|nr:carboxypeptidase-like regulatory domain-containing protein [Gemmatimonadales bacterium]
MSNEVEAAESRLVEEWIRPALGPGTEVRIGAPGESGLDDGTRVALTLLDIAPAPPPRQVTGPVPLQLRARYLVTVSSQTPSAQHQALADLGFSAGIVRGVELDPAPPPPAYWQSLGATSRPSLTVSVLLQRARPTHAAPRVREPLVTRWTPSRPLSGVVMGPGDVPIAGALVEVEGAPHSAYSNHRGEFAFSAVPGSEPPPTLLVSAKGTHLRVRVDATASPDEPVLIRVPLSES